MHWRNIQHVNMCYGGLKIKGRTMTGLFPEVQLRGLSQSVSCTRSSNHHNIWSQVEYCYLIWLSCLTVHLPFQNGFSIAFSLLQLHMKQNNNQTQSIVSHIFLLRCIQSDCSCCIFQTIIQMKEWQEGCLFHDSYHFTRSLLAFVAIIKHIWKYPKQ